MFLADLLDKFFQFPPQVLADLAQKTSGDYSQSQQEYVTCSVARRILGYLLKRMIDLYAIRFQGVDSLKHAAR